MANLAIVGAQWGDEGKGKAVDLLAPRFDYVVRFQGGHNAGHSVVFNGERFALHVLPSGVFCDKTVNLIGNGVVVEPFSLIKEIEGLRTRGVTLTPDRLKISDRAHIIMPYHGIIDRFRDSRSGQRKIGTTGRGIGPTYEWKAARHGIRFCDIRHMARLGDFVADELAAIDKRFRDIEELKQWSATKVMAKLKPALEYLAPFVVDSVELLAEARAESRSLLFEGAQAALLDVDFGTYPFVTSSNSCAAGVTAGAGVPPSAIERVIGVAKAYCTRVGEGPFPTELQDDIGALLKEAGREFGTTTGRARRCGWLDLVALRYAARINGFDALALMKLDVLDGLDEIKVCVAYELDGQTIDFFPASHLDLANATPRYETLPGWRRTIAGVQNFEDLPQQAKDYVAFIEGHAGCPVHLIGVGPDRQQTIVRSTQFFGARQAQAV